VAVGFEPVRSAFQQNLASGLDVGAGLCVVRDGEVIVDLWGGCTDIARESPWQADTLINVYSTTKGVAALAFALLVDDGMVDYDQPVAEIWPELRAGETGLTVGDLLAHRGGLCGISQKLEVADLYDWDRMCRLLERQEPLWEPGTAAGYHAVTWGYLPGELVRRLTGRSLGELIAERVSGLLDADFYLGLPETEDARVAALIGANRAVVRARDDSPEIEATPPVMPLYPIALENPIIRPYQDAFSLQWRRAEIAASNGHASARAIARIYGAAVTRGQDALLSTQTLQRLLQPRVEETRDLVLGQRIRRSAGMILNHDDNYGPEPRAFGHAGAGGSVGFADPVRRFGFGFVMNQMLSGGFSRQRIQRLLTALYDCAAASGW
jgi:CubicO group peptidase (beta-lactamase class C family)